MDDDKKRTIDKIRDLDRIKLPENTILTQRGEVGISELEEGDRIFKEGDINLQEVSKDAIAKYLEIKKGLNFEPEEIATKPEEINRNTKYFIADSEFRGRVVDGSIQIDREIKFKNSQIKEIPKGAVFNEYVDFYNSQITEIPENIKFNSERVSVKDSKLSEKSIEILKKKQEKGETEGLIT